ncbi:MAG: transposase, partial [Thiotrichaceae bacterium]|nr:transposase [Thiotrichaceae bacterium]
FLQERDLKDGCIHALDSTDVATSVDTKPLVKLELPDGQVIRIYSDLNCDSGERRSKRNKSKMFVGYRVHTLCVIDVASKIAFPLLTLTTAANHHDSQLLMPMMELAKAVGLEIKVLAADSAYEKTTDHLKLKGDGCNVVVPPKKNRKVPTDVDKQTGEVFMNQFCEQPMEWDGFDLEQKTHTFICNDATRQCPFYENCQKERSLPLDNNLLSSIPACNPKKQQIMELRKVTERPFNLLKNMDGLEHNQMKTQRSISMQTTLSHMVGLFKVLAGKRAVLAKKGQNKVPKQQELKLAA